MKIKLRYKRNKHQRDFDEDITSNFLHMSSGFGGGKSYALVMKMFKLSYLNKNISGGLMAPSYKDLKRDIIPIFDDICEQNNLTKYVKFHGTDHYYTFPWTRGRLYLFSGEVKLRGPNLGYFGINEATLIKHERYKEAIGRVRVKSTPFPQIASVGTPEGTGNYMYEQFVEKPMKGSRIIYGDTRDNIENLSDTYIASLENSYDKIMLDAYLRGLWVNMNGNQFYYAHTPKNQNHFLQRQEGEVTRVALDFNVEHMTATCWHYEAPTTFSKGKLTGFEEIVIENNADTDKMIKALMARGFTPENTIIYPDPAGKARKTNGAPDHTILKNAGYEVHTRLAAPRMRQRQLNTNNLLDKGIVEYNPVKMPTMKKDFEAVEQDPVTYEKLKNNPKLTHASDGFDYMTDILFPFSGKKEKSDIIRIR